MGLGGHGSERPCTQRAPGSCPVAWANPAEPAWLRAAHPACDGLQAQVAQPKGKQGRHGGLAGGRGDGQRGRQHDGKALQEPQGLAVPAMAWGGVGGAWREQGGARASAPCQHQHTRQGRTHGASGRTRGVGNTLGKGWSSEAAAEGATGSSVGGQRPPAAGPASDGSYHSAAPASTCTLRPTRPQGAAPLKPTCRTCPGATATAPRRPAAAPGRARCATWARQSRAPPLRARTARW